MNTYQLVTRDDFVSKQIAQNYEENLSHRGWEKSDSPELVIAIGGDGTMLYAFQTYYSETTAFLGVHTGTLGFYGDWNVEETNKLLDHILTSTPRFVEYPLVDIEVENNKGEKKHALALNEIVVKSKTLSTFLLEVYVNDDHFETFRGDGMLVSTPTGSTAYNHAVNGSILHPSIEAIQVAELAAINNKEFRTLGRSFILPKHHCLDLYVKNPEKDVLVGVDGVEISLEGIRKIRTTVSDKKIKFVRYRPFPFWKRVKEKFIDG